MTKTSTKTRKRKAQDSLAAEAPNPKKQLCECQHKARTGGNAIALSMNNYELIQLGISQDGKGKSRIKPKIVEGILNIIRARPRYWHILWRHVETEIQQILDDCKHIAPQKIHSLLDIAQFETERDQRLIKGICAATLDKSYHDALKLIEAQAIPLGNALRHLLGLDRGHLDAEPDRRALVHAFLSIAKLSGFEVDNEVFRYVDPDLHNGVIPTSDPGFRALRSQMLRVVLHYEDHHQYMGTMAEIIGALADGSKNQEEVADESPPDSEESNSGSDSGNDSGNDSESGESSSGSEA